MSKIEKLFAIIKNTNDSISMLANSYKWQSEDFYTQKFSRHIFPFGNKYIGANCPIFVSSLTNKKALSLFNFLTFRDGSLGLARFFIECPKPHNSEAMIAVHESLYYLVPLAWRENVVLFKVKNTKITEKTEHLIITGLVYKECLDLSVVENTLSSIKTSNFKTISLYLSYNNRYNSNQENSHQLPYFQKVFKKVLSHLPEHTRILSLENVLSYNQLNAKSISLNRQRLYYSDSLIDFILRERGVSPLDEMDAYKEDNSKIFIPVSFYHGYLFHDQWNTNYEMIRERIERGDLRISEEVLQQELRNPRELRDIDDIKLATSDFFDYVLKLSSMFENS